MSIAVRHRLFPVIPALWVMLCCVAPCAHAAVPEQSFPAQRAAAPDTGQFLPRWLHLHGSIGYGWMSSPRNIRERYEAGQDFEFGIETRPQPRLRVRLNGEYQVLPALGKAVYTFVRGGRVGATGIDTVSFDWQQRGWLAAGRAEVQARVLPHTWLLGGGGYGYLASGVRAFHFDDPFGSVDIAFPGSSGWGWLGSAGLRYEFDLFGPTLGVETRWSAFTREQDELQFWSIRIGWQGK